jgi:hypothetical protein
MQRLGRGFGSLVYVLDAFEDQKRDAREGTFNALAHFSGMDGRREILSRVSQIEPDLPGDLGDRLRINVEERLGMRPRVLRRVCRKPLRERWTEALSLARRLREREAAGWMKGAVVLASVAALGFLFPHHTRSATTWRECLGVGLNLMALGTFFATPVEPPQFKGSGGPGSRFGGDCCGWCYDRCCQGCGDACCTGCGDACCDCSCCCEICA